MNHMGKDSGKRAVAARRSLALAALIACGAASVLSLGGCPQMPATIPISAPSLPPGSGVPGLGTGNIPPLMTFLEPASDVQVSPGEIVTITFTVIDPDDDAQYTVFLDPDQISNNGNEVELESGLESNVPLSGRTITVDTAALTIGTYRIRGNVTDAVNGLTEVTALGNILLYPPGLQKKNRPPFVTAIEPSSSRGVVQGDTVRIQWCGRDADDQARILILLDYDQDANNDVQFHTAQEVQAVCNGSLPRRVEGAILLACETEDDCTDPTQGPFRDWVIDVSQIPPRPDGQPYRVRVDITDQRPGNPTVHSYAPGGVSVLPIISSSLVDVRDIGRRLGGAVFQGFDAGGRTGHAFTRVPDLEFDGADEFLIVSQYGRPFERGPVGSAAMPYGRPGQRFGGLIPINSVGTTIPGLAFGNWPAEASEGIVSVSFVPDLDATPDNRVELLFGMPRVQGMDDPHDDDPCDTDGCYYDYLPNPVSDSDPSNDDLSGFDFDEGPACDPAILCSNDSDLSTITPIVSGYMIYVSSRNLTGSGYIDLGDAGSAQILGARFRGAWYDFDISQVEWPYAINPATRFGQNVASMPPLSDGWDDSGLIPTFPGGVAFGIVAVSDNPFPGTTRDGWSEILTSAPMAYEERGEVVLTFGRDMVNYNGTPDFNSIPNYDQSECEPCIVTRRLWYPDFRMFVGAAPGDRLGWAGPAGDFNLDGGQDILMGAPGADRAGLVDNGVLYVLFGRVDIGNVFLGWQNPPRMEVHGVSAGDELGKVNRLLEDVNGDSIPDVGFGVPRFDPNGLTDAGMVGVIFGGRPLTGENIFRVTQVGTEQLPGVRFLGTQPGGLAGNHIASAGDFNADGFGDLLVVAPNETRSINGQVRRGVVYLIFGGFHLRNQIFLLTQVGTSQLPGVVFVSPFAAGTADEAPLECAEAAGDVDGDGFGDILLGAPTADYVNPLEPSQRRLDAGEAYLIYGTNAIQPGS